jgi:hypothetical protein
MTQYMIDAAVYVGWVKEQRDVPIKTWFPLLMGTLRFTHPTFN